MMPSQPIRDDPAAQIDAGQAPGEGRVACGDVESELPVADVQEDPGDAGERDPCHRRRPLAFSIGIRP
jgi:hypothetical protein